jgi:hypothetical protein
VQVIELLSVRAPSTETKLKLLKEIAEEHGLDWDPSASETEFSRTHEDLLVCYIISFFPMSISFLVFGILYAMLCTSVVCSFQKHNGMYISHF